MSGFEIIAISISSIFVCANGIVYLKNKGSSKRMRDFMKSLE